MMSLYGKIYWDIHYSIQLPIPNPNFSESRGIDIKFKRQMGRPVWCQTQSWNESSFLEDYGQSP